MDLLIFFVILSVLVLVHELGHFVTARLCGVAVEEFGFGLPPRAIKLFERKGTLFSLNWLPIGGFVKLKGEDSDKERVTPDMFYAKPMWKRALVLVAGVVMNFVLGVVVFGAVYTYLGIPTKTDRVRIDVIAKDSPAELAGMMVNDWVQKIRIQNLESRILNTDELVKLINDNKGKEITLVVDRGGKEMEIKLTPRENPPPGEGAAGVVLTNTELIKYPWWQMPWRGALVGISEAFAWGREILGGMGALVMNLLKGKGVSSDISGPVGIYQVSAMVAKGGIIPILQFLGVLSINLGILNLMPFPGLDGGRIAFLGIEKVIGRERKDKFEGTVHTWGIIFLMGLMALITMRDVWRLFIK